MLEFLAEAAHEGEGHVENAALGVSFLTPGFFVALAMIVVIGIMLKAGVPKIIAGMLDNRIAEIRTQLDEAKKLRAEAQALKDRYEKQAAAANEEIAQIKANAEEESRQIVEKAKQDATDLVARREKMAEEKIAAAERSAVSDLREKAAQAAAVAARGLIAENHSAQADKALVDEAIAKL